MLVLKKMGSLFLLVSVAGNASVMLGSRECRDVSFVRKSPVFRDVCAGRMGFGFACHVWDQMRW